ncbi:MAG: roadblock/LC7 domain-containing protein [Methanoregulaceae archaeon]
MSGAILLESGCPAAAWVQSGTQFVEGKKALALLSAESESNRLEGNLFRAREYDGLELEKARLLCNRSWLIPSSGIGSRETCPEIAIDENKVSRILAQPGVLAISAFYEGFPVKSFGSADFEHIAVTAEDLVRAVRKMSLEMETGPVRQIILETDGHKFIIAPYGDLSVCVLTAGETPLGLIRVLLKDLAGG